MIIPGVEDVVEDAARHDGTNPAQDHTMVINMGPQHPSTHGVLRLVLEIDGETSSRTRPTSAISTPASRRPARPSSTSR